MPFIPFKTAFSGQTNGKTSGNAVHSAVQTGVLGQTNGKTTNNAYIPLIKHPARINLTGCVITKFWKRLLFCLSLFSGCLRLLGLNLDCLGCEILNCLTSADGILDECGIFADGLLYFLNVDLVCVSDL